MLNLSTRVWTDGQGKEHKLEELTDTHILNIQRYLQRLLKAGAEPLRDRYESTASEYDAHFSDKDWYFPGSAFHGIDDLVDDALREAKVSLMLISASINRRRKEAKCQGEEK